MTDRRRWLPWLEIEKSHTCQLVFWAHLLAYCLDIWVRAEWGEGAQPALRAAGDFVCWPHFQSCGSWSLFNSIPHGYGHGYWTALKLAAICGAAVGALRRQWSLAYWLSLFLFAEKVLFYFFLEFTGRANFQYYHLPLAFVWLFVPHKDFFLRLTFCTLYSFAAVAKFSDSWTEGRYFLPLELGLPLVPFDLIPLATNVVIVFEIFMSWTLFSKHRILQRASFWSWLGFHFYSVPLVGVFYPFHCIPALVALFGRFETLASVRRPLGVRVTAPGLLAIVALAGIHSIPHVIPRDVRWTMEGYQYGLGMFDANHQCRVEVVADGREPFVLTSRSATFRCAPYESWARARQRYCKEGDQSMAVQYRHDASLNGGPFYRIVDTQNLCGLAYSFWGGNSWIKTPNEGAPIVGYPRPNATQRSRASRPEWKDTVFADPWVWRTPAIDLTGWGSHLQLLYTLLWLLWTPLAVVLIFRGRP